MVPTNRFKSLIAACAIVGAAGTANAQLGDAGEILRASEGDAGIILQEYLRPIGEGVGAGLNSGWFNTAKTHKFLGFSLGLRLNAYIVPDDLLEFDLNSLGLSNLNYTGKGGGNAVLSPTFSGSNEAGPLVWLNAPAPNQNIRVTEFNLPQGIDVPITGFPTAQLSVGLLFDTEVMVRYVPESDIPDFGSFGVTGFGVKHNIKQWIPVVNMLPVDISAYFGTNTVTINADFDVPPPEQTANNEPVRQDPTLDFSGQGVEFEATSTSYGLIIGKSIPLISVYAAFGQETARTEVGVRGRYPQTVPRIPTPGAPELWQVSATSNDPVNLTYDNGTSFRTTVGASLKLLFLRVNADYSMGDYPVASLGVAFTIR
jgi:hypothetical protein